MNESYTVPAEEDKNFELTVTMQEGAVIRKYFFKTKPEMDKFANRFTISTCSKRQRTKYERPKV